MFERFESRYEIRGRVLTQTGLHVGVGGSLAVVGSDNPTARDARGLPYIPGSSFKGALRATVEAMLRGIAGDARLGYWACDPLDQARCCVTANDVREKDDAAILALFSRDGTGAACAACRLFGSPWLASRVSVRDLYLSDGEAWPGRIETRDGVAIDRDTETVSGARLYDFEVVPLDTAFDLHVRVENVRRDELGLVLLGLREFETGRARLGGNVSRGLGAVRLEGIEVEAIEGADGLRSYFRNGRGQVFTGADWEAFRAASIGAFLASLEGGRDAS